jgi:hypothetical protein
VADYTLSSKTVYIRGLSSKTARMLSLIPPHQYVFTAWCLVKAQRKIYLTFTFTFTISPGEEGVLSPVMHKAIIDHSYIVDSQLHAV